MGRTATGRDGVVYAGYGPNHVDETGPVTVESDRDGCSDVPLAGGGAPAAAARPEPASLPVSGSCGSCQVTPEFKFQNQQLRVVDSAAAG